MGRCYSRRIPITDLEAIFICDKCGARQKIWRSVKSENGNTWYLSMYSQSRLFKRDLLMCYKCI